MSSLGQAITSSILSQLPVAWGILVQMYIVEQCQGQQKNPGLLDPRPWGDFPESPSTCLCLSPCPELQGISPRSGPGEPRLEDTDSIISCLSLPAKVNVTSRLQAGPLWGDPILTRPWPKRGSGCRDTHRGGPGNKINMGNKIEMATHPELLSEGPSHRKELMPPSPAPSTSPQLPSSLRPHGACSLPLPASTGLEPSVAIPGLHHRVFRRPFPLPILQA